MNQFTAKMLESKVSLWTRRKVGSHSDTEEQLLREEVKEGGGEQGCKITMQNVWARHGISHQCI